MRMNMTRPRQHVPLRSLWFSVRARPQVVIFCICALLTIASILLRRPAELGGGKAGKYATAIFFVILWLAYVIISALALEGLIPTF